jgi:hypothetical protein
MQKWEYQVITVHWGIDIMAGAAKYKGETVELPYVLATLGNDGWELAAAHKESDVKGTTYCKYVFKRPKEE